MIPNETNEKNEAILEGIKVVLKKEPAKGKPVQVFSVQSMAGKNGLYFLLRKHRSFAAIQFR